MKNVILGKMADIELVMKLQSAYYGFLTQHDFAETSTKT